MSPVAVISPSSRAAGAVLGCAVIVVGVVLMRFARPLTGAFNAFYERLPGRVVYPRWFIPAIGGFFVVFGCAVVVLMLVTNR